MVSDQYEKGKKYDMANPHKRWSWNARSGHKRKGIPMIFTAKELTRKAINTPNCEYCGMKLDYSQRTKGGRKPNSPFLDRINNDTEMTMDNIQILCLFCSDRKSWLTQDEYEKILHDRLMIEKI